MHETVLHSMSTVSVHSVRLASDRISIRGYRRDSTDFELRTKMSKSCAVEEDAAMAKNR